MEPTHVKDYMPTSYADAKRLVSKSSLDVKIIYCYIQGFLCITIMNFKQMMAH